MGKCPYSHRGHLLVHQEVDKTIDDTLEFLDKLTMSTYELSGKKEVVAGETPGERDRRRMRHQNEWRRQRWERQHDTLEEVPDADIWVLMKPLPGLWRKPRMQKIMSLMRRLARMSM